MKLLSKWASSWESTSSGVSDQVRLKLACSATEASMRLEVLVTKTRDITLSRQRTTKALVRLREFAGWSAPFLFAYDIRHVFSWSGSNKSICAQINFSFYKYTTTQFGWNVKMDKILLKIKSKIWKCYNNKCKREEVSSRDCPSVNFSGKLL